MLTKIVREDFSIEKTEGTYGPIWVLRKEGERHAYVLRSDAKMNKSWTQDKSPGVHLDVTYGDDPLKHSGDWKGIFPTGDMDKAVDYLMEELNENQQLEYMEEELESVVSTLEDKVKNILSACENFPRYDLPQVMEDVESAYIGLRLAYESALKNIEEAAK